jgi:flagellar basal-body rod modification protein FlgD
VNTIGDATTVSTNASKPAGGTLGKDDFLKLFVTQLQHQDPMNPSDNSQFMAQMAQFSTLEQITNLANATTQMVFSNQVSQSVGLIGRTVTYDKADGTSVTGVASAVNIANGNILVTVGDHQVEPGSIRSVT